VAQTARWGCSVYQYDLLAGPSTETLHRASLDLETQTGEYKPMNQQYFLRNFNKFKHIAVISGKQDHESNAKLFLDAVASYAYTVYVMLELAYS